MWLKMKSHRSIGEILFHSWLGTRARDLLEQGGGGGVCRQVQSSYRPPIGHLGRLLAVGNAVGAGVGVWECLSVRVRAAIFGAGGLPLFKRFPAPGPGPTKVQQTGTMGRCAARTCMTGNSCTVHMRCGVYPRHNKGCTARDNHMTNLLFALHRPLGDAAQFVPQALGAQPVPARVQMTRLAAGRPPLVQAIPRAPRLGFGLGLGEILLAHLAGGVEYHRGGGGGNMILESRGLQMHLQPVLAGARNMSWGGGVQHAFLTPFQWISLHREGKAFGAGKIRLENIGSH